METATQDTIERTLIVNATLDKAWQTLTDPIEVVKWFCDRIEGDFKLGAEVLLIWGDDRCRAKIVVTEPHRRFAFRWIPGVNDPSTPIDESNSTLVQFTLSETTDGIRVQMVESGFLALPGEFSARALKENTSGWDYELRELQEHLA